MTDQVQPAATAAQRGAALPACRRPAGGAHSAAE